MQHDLGALLHLGADFRLRGHVCIVLAICLLAALISFPTVW